MPTPVSSGRFVIRATINVPVPAGAVEVYEWDQWATAAETTRYWSARSWTLNESDPHMACTSTVCKTLTAEYVRTSPSPPCLATLA